MTKVVDVVGLAVGETEEEVQEEAWVGGGWD